MSVGTSARLSIIPFFLVILVYYLHGHARAHRTWRATAVLLLPVVLILCATATALVQPSTMLSVLATTAATHQAVLLTYVGIEHFNTNTVPRHIFWTIRYRSGTMLTIGVLIMEWLRRDNLGSFIDNASFEPTWRYYASYASNYGLLLVFSGQIVHLTWREARRADAARTYRLRNVFASWAFVFVALSAVVVELNLLLTATIGDAYRADLNAVYHGLKPIVCVLLLLSSLPTLLLERPLHYYLQRRQQQDEQVLAYLHGKMMRIVPTLHLDVDGLADAGLAVDRDDQLINEISDAREVVYSHHVPHPELLAPHAEAELLHRLLQEHVVLEQADAERPAVEQVNLLHHTIDVARQLRKRERR